MKIFMVGLIALLAMGCDQKDTLVITKYKITAYSGGQITRVFHTAGAITNKDFPSGWSFVDSASGKKIRVTGPVIIEEE